MKAIKSIIILLVAIPAMAVYALLEAIHNLQISGLPEFWEAHLFVCKQKE